MNGGDGSATWTVHYEVSKTSTSTISGQEGPFTSQAEADAAAEAAKNAAINQLKNEAQGMVDAAIASARAQLANITFSYDEITIPHGFDSTPGALGSHQLITVPANSSNDYQMQNDEWSVKVSLDKIDSETKQQIHGDAEFAIFEWDTVLQRYIPTGGYNQYKVERQSDGTYKVINHSDYAGGSDDLFYTQRNEGRFVIVEKRAPNGYYGDWTDVANPGTAGSVLGKRAYAFEITKALDGQTIQLGNADYNADVGTANEGGTLIDTGEGIVSITFGDRNGDKAYNTDPTDIASNEKFYTVCADVDTMQNDRVLGSITLSKVDLDAARYLAAGSNGDSTIEGAVYDLYAAEDIHHPDCVSGIVDYSKITDANGNPIWHTTAIKLGGAGFKVYRISLLSKADQFTKNADGSYDAASILDAYRKSSYDQDTLKFDFSSEEQAIATMYESDTTAVNRYNATLTADGDFANGQGLGWVPTNNAQEYRLSEIFTNEEGILRVQGLPYGQYIVVETTVPKDVFQAEPFLITVNASSPQSGFTVPAGSITTPSGSYMTYNILDEELEGYLQLVKIDIETGNPVKIADTAFNLYYIAEGGHETLVEMNDPKSGNAWAKTSIFYTDSNGEMKTPEKLPLGRYRIVEVEGPQGYFNDRQYNVVFELTSDRVYQVSGGSADGMDDYVITENYYNHETLGQIKIRKIGNVLTGYENGQFVYETDNLANATYEIHAQGDIPTPDNQGTLWYADGDLVATVTTAKDGQVDEVRFSPTRTTATYDFLKVTHDGTKGEVTITLPLGTYTISEVQAPYGFVHTDHTYTVVLDWDNQYNDLVLAKTIIDHTQDGDVVYDYSIKANRKASPVLFQLHGSSRPCHCAAVKILKALGIGIHVLHKDGVCHLSGCFDLPPQQAGTAAHKNHTPRAQVKLALAQCAQHIVDELLRLIFYQRGDFFPITAPLPLQENGIHIGFLQQNVQIGAGFRTDAVVQQNHTILQRVTGRQVGAAVLQQQIVRREAAHVQNQRTRHRCQFAQYHGCRCKRLRITLHIADQDAVQLVTVGEVDRFLALEVAHERFVLRAEMCGRQADGKVNGHQPGGISSLCFDFLRDGKQRQNEEALVCGFVLLVRDTLR